ncbi:hypothetical protein ACFFKC_13325 [Pseudoduganella danionis]|uniref:hypothetical protein n=1 Tax=Pseudoduganella danionis TaxID=1890295 RepID=UPI001E3B8E66|nr:hypothetical protein [Pseudoduganella danionis]
MDGMEASVSVPVERQQLERLIEQLARRGGAPDLQQALSAAIEMWLGEQVKLQMGADPACVRGYQWKTVFLPEGTLLCTYSYGDEQHARVIGRQIIFCGRAVSPNQFAHWAGRSTRNAWNDLYLRRPQDKFYILASRLRAQVAQELERATATVTTSAAPEDVPARTALPSAPNNLLAEVLHAVVAALQTSEQTKSAIASLFPQPVLAPPRDCSKGEGWDLPERRKFRFRLEDVAFS